jgi:hypothetical protein
MESLAINWIIVLANAEMRKDRARLEVEDNGREVAGAQGRIVGYKKLVGGMAAEFRLTQVAIEDLGDEPVEMKELDDDTLDALDQDITTIQKGDEWKALLARIEADIEGMKDHLLFRAEKSRDLDLCQGQYKGETIYQRLFNSVQSESKHREEKREQERKNPKLFKEA